MPEDVVEHNWFFRLSRYRDALVERITSGELAITPAPYRDEVLAFLRRGLHDISVSRSVQRARGWGIPVPDDPDQVVYVWFDALTNYISALDYGTPGSAAFDEWWTGADRRVHVIGKGILRFHAVYWPAFLLSAGEALPTEIHVHPYLTVDGAKLSKSSGTADRSGRRRRPLRHRSPPLVADARHGGDRRHRLHRAPSRRPRRRGPRPRHRQRRQPRRLARPPLPRRGVVPDADAEPVDEASALPAVVAALLATFERRAATTAILDAVAALNRDLDDDAARGRSPAIPPAPTSSTACSPGTTARPG